MVTARRDDRERHLTLIVSSLPDSVTNDATGRPTLFLGRSRGVTACRLAFASAAAMTTRPSEEGMLQLGSRVTFLEPTLSLSLTFHYLRAIRD